MRTRTRSWSCRRRSRSRPSSATCSRICASSGSRADAAHRRPCWGSGGRRALRHERSRRRHGAGDLRRGELQGDRRPSAARRLRARHATWKPDRPDVALARTRRDDRFPHPADRRRAPGRADQASRSRLRRDRRTGPRGCVRRAGVDRARRGDARRRPGAGEPFRSAARARTPSSRRLPSGFAGSARTRTTSTTSSPSGRPASATSLLVSVDAPKPTARPSAPLSHTSVTTTRRSTTWARDRAPGSATPATRTPPPLTCKGGSPLSCAPAALLASNSDAITAVGSCAPRSTRAGSRARTASGAPP